MKEMASTGDKSAVAKVKKIKKQKHTQYLKNKALGKRKEWNKKRRRAKFWNFIDSLGAYLNWDMSMKLF